MSTRVAQGGLTFCWLTWLGCMWHQVRQIVGFFQHSAWHVGWIVQAGQHATEYGLGQFSGTQLCHAQQAQNWKETRSEMLDTCLTREKVDKRWGKFLVSSWRQLSGFLEPSLRKEGFQHCLHDLHNFANKRMVRLRDFIVLLIWVKCGLYTLTGPYIQREQLNKGMISQNLGVLVFLNLSYFLVLEKVDQGLPWCLTLKKIQRAFFCVWHFLWWVQYSVWLRTG